LIAGSNVQVDADSPEFVTLSAGIKLSSGSGVPWRLVPPAAVWRTVVCTGVDQVYPEKYDPPQRDLTAEEDFMGWNRHTE